MTVKKAIKILDFIIQNKDGMRNDFQNPEKSWHIGESCVSGLAYQLRDVMRKDIENLKLILKELVPNCKHPKKMRDRTPNGDWYCMNCNMDL